MSRPDPRRGFRARLATLVALAAGIAALAPAVAAADPTPVTGDSAALGDGSVRHFTGSVNPNGVASQYFFQYGPSDINGAASYATFTPVTDAGSGNGSSSVAADTSATDPGRTEQFDPGQILHYRLAAKVPGSAPVHGADYTTAVTRNVGNCQGDNPQLPGVQASLQGRINPDGYPVQYNFEYGTTTSYGQDSSPIDDTGTNDVTVGDVVHGLLPNTTYHYKIFEVFSTGKVAEGADRTFTTGAASNTTDAICPIGGGGDDPDTTAPGTFINPYEAGTPAHPALNPGVDATHSHPYITERSAVFTFHSTEDNSTFSCKLDLGQYSPCAPGAAPSRDSNKHLSNLSDGPHTFSVFATDSSANADLSPASRKFYVDTLKPSVTSTTPQNNPHGAPSSFIKGARVTVEYSCADHRRNKYASGVHGCLATRRCPHSHHAKNCAVKNGDRLDTDSVGDHKLHITAIDRAGNRTDVDVHYHVKPKPKPKHKHHHHH
jgi:hypothetical protein